jgi:hypothetical protein
MTSQVTDLSDVTFYDFPWSGPTFAVVEYGGQLYDIRKGWGCREGWTNSYVAIPLSEEEVQEYADNLLEVSDDEVLASYGKEAIEGILEVVRGQ